MNGIGSTGQQRPGIKVDLRDMPDEKCPECGGVYFVSVIRIKRISKIMVGSDKDQQYPIPLLQCATCGWREPDPFSKPSNGTEPTDAPGEPSADK